MWYTCWCENDSYNRVVYVCHLLNAVVTVAADLSFFRTNQSVHEDWGRHTYCSRVFWALLLVLNLTVPCGQGVLSYYYTWLFLVAKVCCLTVTPDCSLWPMCVVYYTWLFLVASMCCLVRRFVVSSWTLASRQPHRVPSGRTTHSNCFTPV